MKILLISREFPPEVKGGVAYHVYNLARSLRDLGQSVEILTGKSTRNILSTEDSYYDKSKELLDFKNIKIHQFSYPSLIAPRLWFNYKLNNVLRSINLNKFDVIHSHDFIDFNNLDYRGIKILKIHFNLFKKHKYLRLSFLLKTIMNLSLWRIEKLLEKRALKTSLFRIYNSNFCRNEYKKEYNFLDINYKVIYNGIDIKTFTFKKIKSNYFIAVIGDDYRKGIDILLRAIKNLRNKNIHIKIKLIRSISKKFKKVLRYYPEIEVIGRVNYRKLPYFYQNAMALIHPAIYEPFGNVILESLACGTPVIISNKDHCGAAEIINNNIGLTFDPIKNGDLENKISYFLKNKSRYVPETCRDFVKNYTWEKTAQKTIEYISEIKRN